MSNKIKIDTVTGGKDKNDLKGCYFLPSSTVSGAYDFYDTNNNVLASGISGSSFSFSLSGYTWQIQNLVISSSAASGDWSNDDPTITADENGSFQAQAGGGGIEEEDVAVSPTASTGDKIKIDKVTGGKNKYKLKDCYFLPSRTLGTYNFYDTHNNVLAENISGSTFTFSLDNLDWQIQKLVITSSTASGNWKNNNPQPIDDESGTFQAQAGGGGDPEAKAAKAGEGDSTAKASA